MKKINQLGWMSLIALLGFFGLFTENNGMLGFFGFAVYARYFFVVPDELFVQNVSKAASIGFFAGVFATCLAMAFRVLVPSVLATYVSLAASFIVSVVSFSVSLVVLEFMELREEKHGA